MKGLGNALVLVLDFYIPIAILVYHLLYLF